jgi:hypothetical protein
MDRAIALQRQQTLNYISMDPTEIVLIPTVVTRQASGAQLHDDGPPRAVQTFKVIPQGFTAHGAKNTVTLNGKERVIDIVLMGAWDAVVEVGDHWVDNHGRRCEVISLDDGHEWEVKANVEAHG